MSSYSHKLNDISVFFCDFNFITNEEGDRIFFENVEENYKQANYIVTTDDLPCSEESKDSYSSDYKNDT